MDRLDKAFETIDRAQFLPSDVRHMADYDTALPIGYGQTNSQPYTVRVMLEWLDIKPGNKVLDVGSGSGWTAALMSKMVGSQGRVYAVERVPELVQFGRENCQRLAIKNVEFHSAGNKLGLLDAAPFDRILVSASAGKLPQELVEQLKPGGKMVIPVYDDILEISIKSTGALAIKKHEGFDFVPLL